jgi:uncharacterized membrane protein YraQ (UPF0718 family)
MRTIDAVHTDREGGLSIAPRATGRHLALIAAVLISAALGLSLTGVASLPQVRNFTLVFGSLLIEAFPFVVLGAAVSASIEVFVPAAAFARLGRLPNGLQMPLAGLGGFAFPVCECGSVPVARRLILKGLTPGAAMTFMFAAPIVNPVVLASTAIAYQGRSIMWAMVIGRAVLGLVTAIAVGWVMSRRTKTELLRAPHHDHSDAEPAERRWSRLAGQMAQDLMTLGGYLVIGAAVAAALQTFLPQSFLGSVAGTPVVNILSLMGLAVLLSLCSESDAFVAASFVQFGPAAQLSFLVLGPMLDAKLAFLYGGTFGKGFVRTVAVVTVAVTLVGALWMEVLLG